MAIISVAANKRQDAQQSCIREHVSCARGTAGPASPSGTPTRAHTAIGTALGLGHTSGLRPRVWIKHQPNRRRAAPPPHAGLGPAGRRTRPPLAPLIHNCAPAGGALQPYRSERQGREQPPSTRDPPPRVKNADVNEEFGETRNSLASVSYQGRGGTYGYRT